MAVETRTDHRNAGRSPAHESDAFVARFGPSGASAHSGTGPRHALNEGAPGLTPVLRMGVLAVLVRGHIERPQSMGIQLQSGICRQRSELRLLGVQLAFQRQPAVE